MAANNWAGAVQGFSAAVELAGLAVPRELRRADQEFRLGQFAGLASEAAAACVQAGQPARAVELFEQGRAVMFSQILDTRSDLTALRQAHSELAEQFTHWRDALDQPDTHRAQSLSGERDSTTAGVSTVIVKNLIGGGGQLRRRDARRDQDDGGSIFMTGSIASVKGFRFWSVYAASKAVLHAYARVWLSELKDRRNPGQRARSPRRYRSSCSTRRRRRILRH